MGMAMKRKTISLDLEAYRRLKRARRSGESFSEVIRRVVEGSIDTDAYLKRLRSIRFSDSFVEAVEEGIAFRRRN
jgi:predicted CopG family antitoxin